tara:strand:+ start:1088 stop:2242 length:1155 start_codon:yes stop_codon:yes gene_type:complete
MILNIYTDRDATLFEKYPTQNTGIDPILSLTKIESGSLFQGFYQSNTYNSRILLDFSTELAAISKSIVEGNIPEPGLIAGKSQYFLVLRAAEATSIPISYNLEAFPVSESWENGNGHFDDIPIETDGVSWKYRDGTSETPIEWASGSQIQFDGGGGVSEAGGGTWYTGSSFIATASFDYQSPDIRMNITNMVSAWLGGTIKSNNGLILKRPTADEQSSKRFGKLDFFGKDTNTIYAPRIEVAWRDFEVDASARASITELAEDNVTVYFKNLRAEYKESDQVKVRVACRETYPTKTYSTASFYAQVKRFPTSSFFAVKDAVTEETIIPFNKTFTALSLDSKGNYFNVRFNAFSPERTYRFLIKTESDGGNTVRTYDNGYYFKVVR